MTASEPRPSRLELQLSAHADGMGSETERDNAEALLANDAQARATLERLKQGTDLGREAFADLLKEPVPLDMVRSIRNAPLPRRAIRLPQQPRPSLLLKPSGPRMLGGCVLALLLGTGVGYMVGASPAQIGGIQGVEVGVDQRDWLDDIVSHYRLYARQKDHVAEVPAERPADILEWLTTGTGVSFRIPDLKQSGLKFIGARMFAAGGQPVGMLVYQRGDDGEIIALTFSRHRQEASKSIEDIRSDTGLVNWNTPLGTYVIVGPSSAADLDDIAAKAAGLI